MAVFGVIGCGYVGSDVAVQFKYAGHHLIGTTRSPERMPALRDLVHEAHQLDLTDAAADFAFLEHLDGLLISVAPTQQTEGYNSVFASGLRNLTRALRCRRSTRNLHLTLISTAGIYGDQQGNGVDEDSPLDTSNPVNALLASAEDLLRNIDRPDTQVCVLRLGGIYGPGRDMVAMIRRAAGQEVPKNGNAIPAWSSIVDITCGVHFAFEEALEGTYNLVDDMQLSRRELSTVICDREGLPPVLWGHSEPAGARMLNARVSNDKIKAAGFRFQSPSMLMPESV